MRRLTTVLVLAAAVVAGPAGAALAHECIVANRSEQGSANSGNSANWEHITTDDIIVFITEDPSLVPALSEPYRQAVAEAGLPTSFSIFGRKTLPTKQPNDGKGIDHIFSGGYADQYFAILFELLEA